MSKGPPISIPDLLNHVQDTTPDTWNAFPLRPSAAGFCTRRLAYDTVNYRTPGSFPVEQNEARIKRLLSFGSSVEYHLIQQLNQIKEKADDFEIRYKQQALPLFFLKPVSNENPPLVEGSLDFAVKINGELIFCDAKSYGEKYSSYFKTKTAETYEKYNGFKSLEKLSENGWYAPDLKAFLKEANDPFLSDNFYQLNAYCNSEFAKQHDVRLGSILKYNKNDSGLYEIRFTPSQEMYDEVRAKFQKAYEAAVSGDPTSAPRDYSLGTARCAFCPFKSYCHSEDALKAFFKTFGEKKWPDDLLTSQGKPKKGLEAVAQYLEDFIKGEALSASQSATEERLIKEMLDKKLVKVRLGKDEIYELKHYKTGGVGGGPRMAVKRTKA